MTNRQVGWILFDSARTESEKGFRSWNLSDRAIVFQFDDVTVDLLVLRGTEGSSALHGQVIRKCAMAPLSGACVRIEDAEEPGRTDDHGHFVLDMMRPEESHILQIESGEMEMICRIPSTSESGLP